MAKILIIADPGDRCSAVPRGLQLAQKLGFDAEVVAFGFVSFKSHGITGREQQQSMKRQVLDSREAQAQQRIDKYSAPDQKITLKVVWSDTIHEWVNKRVLKGFEGVVKTAHRSGTFIYTSTDWHLLRECPVPVLLVANKRWSRTKPVLGAIDLTTQSRQKKALNDKVISHAKWLAKALDTKLSVISALHISPVLTELDLVSPVTHVHKRKAELKPEITRLAKLHKLPESVFRIKRGPVDKVIMSEAARLRAQLVVIGTVGRKGVRARLLGNTAEQVLQHINTDIVALKP